MIATIAIALQLTAVAVQPVSIRAGDRVTPVPVLAVAAGVGVRADIVASALGGTLQRSAGDRYTLTVGGVIIELEPSLPMVRIDTVVIPLVSAPWMSGTGLYIPLQLLTEIVPRYGTGLMYDAAAREIRSFRNTAARSSATPAATERPAGADATRVSEPPPAPRRAAVRRTVVIDAGHGGRDPGGGGPMACPSGRRYEKDIVLEVGRLLQRELREAGISVVMTRTSDTLIGLADRGPIANKARGDLFVSLHVNAAPNTWRNPSAGRGFETYFLAEAKTEEARRVEEMENSAVRFETGAQAPKGDPLSFIINDMAQNEHLRESMDLAERIQGGIRGVHPGPDRGVKQANFAVLRGAYMPAVLVELGFGTNPQDAAYMCSTAGQRQLASAIAAGTIRYLSSYEQRVGGGR
jgi:N-acetylmuramoyl-L-alanine amidase